MRSGTYCDYHLRKYQIHPKLSSTNYLKGTHSTIFPYQSIELIDVFKTTEFDNLLLSETYPITSQSEDLITDYLTLQNVPEMVHLTPTQSVFTPLPIESDSQATCTPTQIRKILRWPHQLDSYWVDLFQLFYDPTTRQTQQHIARVTLYYVCDCSSGNPNIHQASCAYLLTMCYGLT